MEEETRRFICPLFYKNRQEYDSKIISWKLVVVRIVLLVLVLDTQNDRICEFLLNILMEFRYGEE